MTNDFLSDLLKSKTRQYVDEDLYSRGWDPARDKDDPRFESALRQAEARAISKAQEDVFEEEQKALDKNIKQESNSAAEIDRLRDLINKTKQQNVLRKEAGLSELPVPALPQAPKPMPDINLNFLNPTGMAESLPPRSGDVGMPIIPQMPAPMGMAESLAARSGDIGMPEVQKPTGPKSAVTDLFKKEAVVDDASQVKQDQEQSLKDTELEDAIRNRDNLMALMMMGKGAEKIGTSISGTQSDKGYMDLLQPFAEAKVKDVLTKRRAEADKVDLDTKKFNFAFAKDKDDPNSPTSKFYRDTLKELTQGAGLAMKIPDNLSAAEMEKVYPNIINIVNAKEARAARLQQAELTAAMKKDAAGKKTEEEKKKFTQGLRKEVTSGQYGKMFGNVNNAQKASGAIAEFLKDPTGYSDYATLMTGLKALQGDESVVREAEIRLGIEAGSFKDAVTNRIEKLRTGKSLQPGQRENILKSVQILHDIALRQYMDGIKPIIDQAELEGIDPGLIIPGNITKDKTRDSASGEVERLTKDGRTAIFDAKTKKFLRYKDQ